MNERAERQKGMIALAKQKKAIAKLLGDPPPEEEDELSTDLTDVANGVSLSWLHHMFGMDRNTAKMKLAGCPHLRLGKGGARLYSLPQAAAYLVEPKFDLERTLKSMKPGDLPHNLQPAVWQAKLARQKWEVNAGDLWATEDVLEVFTTVFKHMRITMNLWVDKLERVALTDEQRTVLTEQVDSLQRDLHHQLIEMPKKRQTRSQLQDLDVIEGPPGQFMDVEAAE